jgi:hypothetical protein
MTPIARHHTQPVLDHRARRHRDANRRPTHQLRSQLVSEAVVADYIRDITRCPRSLAGPRRLAADAGARSAALDR